MKSDAGSCAYSALSVPRYDASIQHMEHSRCFEGLAWDPGHVGQGVLQGLSTPVLRLLPVVCEMQFRELSFAECMFVICATGW